MAGLEVQVAEGEGALREFLLFGDEVNASLDVRWPVLVDFVLPILAGRSPTSEGRTFRPLVVRDGGRIVARAAAVVDRRYIGHWDEPLGHMTFFEALPGTRDAVRLLADEVCAWLREQGMDAVRTGFGPMDWPYLIDAHDVLPPMLLRQNGPHYHSLLKESGFVSEKGWVDYKIEVTPEIVARYEGSLRAAEAGGFEIRSLGSIDPDTRVTDYTATWNEAFRHHWGAAPTTEAENAAIFDSLGPFGMYDTSVVAYRDGEPAGVLWVTPDMSGLAVGREVRPEEKLNFLGIGVRQAARGRGLNMAMASFAYLRLIEAGATHLSYTLVLDDNWPSRRTAEKLGASVCANYMTYRRTLRG